MQKEPGLSGLRAWIGLMQGRFADYPHLYSGFAYRMGINFIMYSMTH